MGEKLQVMQRLQHAASKLSAAFLKSELINLADCELPLDLTEAEIIEDSVIASFGQVGAWKLGATNQAGRDAAKLPRFFMGALPSHRVLMNCSDPSGPWLSEVGVECEYAFRFGHELRPGGAVDAKSIEAALEGVYAAFEIPGCRYAAGLGKLGGFATVADHGAGGWMVIGQRCAIANLSDLDNALVRLSVDGKPIAEGKAAERIDGFAQQMLVDFVELAHSRGHVIEVGQFLVPGSCTGYVKVPLGARVTGDFGGLAKVEAVFQAEQ